jgi:diacylglycerol kinase (ATP)
MSPKWFIVHNPVSGIQRAGIVKKAVERRFLQAGLDFEIYQTTGETDVTQVVRDACLHGYNRFVAVGGDGTVDAVADVLAGTQIPLGIIPAGTGNGLARDLKIPLSVRAALDILLGEHCIRRIDLIQLGSQFRTLNLSVGLTADVIRDMRQEDKRRLGLAAYLVGGISKIFRAKPLLLELIIDGELQDFRTTEVLLLNSPIFREPILDWHEDVIIDDGELDLFVFPAVDSLNFLQTVWNFLRGRPKRDPDFQWFPVRRDLVLQCRQPVNVQSDGDFIGMTPVTARLVPGALHVIVASQ